MQPASRVRMRRLAPCMSATGALVPDRPDRHARSKRPFVAARQIVIEALVVEANTEDLKNIGARYHLRSGRGGFDFPSLDSSGQESSSCSRRTAHLHGVQTQPRAHRQ